MDSLGGWHVTLFRSGAFKLHAGALSDWKLDLDALGPDDWETLARLVARRVGPFERVEGIPRGGVSLAQALERYASRSGGLLLVDDVCTTGGSLEKARRGREARGFVVFARGTPPPWVEALFLYTGISVTCAQCGQVFDIGEAEDEMSEPKLCSRECAEKWSS